MTIHDLATLSDLIYRDVARKTHTHTATAGSYNSGSEHGSDSEHDCSDRIDRRILRAERCAVRDARSGRMEVRK